MVYMDSQEIIIKKIQIILSYEVIHRYRITGDALVVRAEPPRTSSN
jgi:hypothetical protein